MPEYRRSLLQGGTFFFTVVTCHRQPILVSPEARSILHMALDKVNLRFPFVIDAICLLPGHIHCIWTLPEGDTNYAIRWGEIKKRFTKAYLNQIGPGEQPNASRLKRGEATIWQRRFWEHTLRDLDDYHRHLDYIHYNPLKHGLVSSVADWRWSSFHRYVKLGYYAGDWGSAFDEKKGGEEFGE
ncbi:MAG TPA: transposase [Anaerolineaceae bacterium]|nr:transposase [Anaerolineaceae bacterium]